MKPRSLTALIGVAGLLALPLALAGAQAPASADTTLSGTTIAINDGPGDALDPQVSGNWVTYYDDLTDTDIVHYYDLATGADSSIPNNGDNDITPAISGTTVVYQDVNSAGGSTIDAYDIGSGNPPTAIDPETGAQQFDPAIGGDTVAWTDYTANPSTPQIMVYNTETQTVTDLSDDPSTVNLEPAVSPTGSVVVWAKCAAGGYPCDIWEGILGSDGTWSVSQLTDLASAGDDSEYPTTDGNIVAYVSERSGTSGLYWQPVGGGAEQDVPLPAGSGSVNLPHASGGLVSFADYPNGGTISQVYVYSLATQTLYQVTDGTESIPLEDLDVAANGDATVVWETVASNYQVNGFEFQVPQAAQAISFTAAAAGEYGGSALLSATGGGSGNPVTFSLDQSSGPGVCSLSGNTVSYTGVGSCVIDANQAGGLDYLAAPTVVQTIAVGPAPQTISFTAPSTGLVGGSAALSATGGASGNAVTFALDPSSGSGVCSVSGDTVSYLAAGSCVIDASQAGDTDYSAAPPVSQTITVDQAPVFTADSPPLSVVSGQAYNYTFTASGAPAPGYALTSGAPSWLSIDAATGAVTGTPPAGTTSFSYAVTASNSVGMTTAGPYTVTVTATSTKADISVALSCPASMTAGSAGTCKLTVANAGPADAIGVAAGLDLPPGLTELSCSPGCADVAGLLIWTMPSLAAGASANFTVTVRATAAGKDTLLAAAASQNPDPDLFNNIAVQVITISR
jgi:Tol biopolymer transport system component